MNDIKKLFEIGPYSLKKEKKPGVALVHFTSSTAATTENNEAIAAYKKSISLNKDFSEAYNNLANVQKKN